MQDSGITHTAFQENILGPVGCDGFQIRRLDTDSFVISLQQFLFDFFGESL